MQWNFVTDHQCLMLLLEILNISEIFTYNRLCID